MKNKTQTNKKLSIKNILFFDIETSGLNIKEDKILQISGFLYDYNSNKIIEDTKFDVYIDPRKDFSNTNFTLNISKDASDLHGITTDYLDNNKDKTISLKQFFETIFKKLLIDENTNAIGTYNGTTFDIPFLIENLKSIGYDGNEIEKLFIGLYNVDSYIIETKLTSRKLEDVYEKYTGTSPDSIKKDGIKFHNSYFDIEGTLEVFKAQTGLSKYNQESMIQPILCTNNSFIIDSGGIYKEQPIINIGKYKGKLVTEVIENDRNYMTWYWNNVVSVPGRKYLTEYLQSLSKH